MAHEHSVYDTDPHFTINPTTRVIKNESLSKTCVIQNDHNSERFTFEIPRLVDGHDMSLCNVVQVHYINVDPITKEQNADVYEVQDGQVLADKGAEYFVFSWLLSQNATRLVGSLNFLIRFSCVADDGTVEYVWNTGIHNGISISNGIYNSEFVVEQYADVLNAWYADLINASDAGVNAIVDAQNKALARIEDASVMEESVLNDILDYVMPLDETEPEPHVHSWKEATCTTPKTCSVCGATEGEALGHNWVDATYTAPKTCSRCGVTEGDPLEQPNALSGKWTWNDTINFTEDVYDEYNSMKFSVNFTSKSPSYQASITQTEFTSISIYMPFGVGTKGTLQYHWDGGSTINICDSSNNYIVDSRSKTIDFGETEQTVDADFYTWFTANATKIS